MKFIIWFYLIIPTVLSLWSYDIDIYSDKDCWNNDNNRTSRMYAGLVKFSPKNNYEKENCSVHIVSPWSSDIQNGFGVFLPYSMDCSSTVTIECLQGNNLSKQPPVEFTCYTNSRAIEMACNVIGLTFKRNLNVKRSIESTNIQVVALAKEPCMDRDISFQCPKDYPHSCIDRNFRCNGRVECPSGDDERDCDFYSYSPNSRLMMIVLVVLGSIFMICVLSAVLICCCCRVAFNAIIHRLCPTYKNKSIEKGEIAVVTGEDAGLMKGLTTPSVIQVLPAQPTEPSSLMIDSTKPVYPRL